MFCPKCGSILVPKKEDSKRVMACSCGYKSSDFEIAKITENVNNKGKRSIQVIEKEVETLPTTTESKCEKCGNQESYFWTQQTRAGDEPETRFYKCKKCGNTWREY